MFLKFEFQNDRSINFGAVEVEICLLPLTTKLVVDAPSVIAFIWETMQIKQLGNRMWVFMN